MKLLLFITSLTLISFGCINTSVARINESSIDVPTTGINTSRDVLGWDKVHLNMKRKDLVKALGSKLEPLSKDLSAHYVIKNVQFGPITTDLRIIMFHTGDDDNRDPVANLSADYQGPINNVLVENITKHFIRTYGDGEVLVDGHSVQGNYKKRIRWRFPTTTI